MITALDKKTALVLIDLQKGILKMDVAHPIEGVLGKAALLIDAFRKENLPIVVVNVNPVGAAWRSSRKEGGAVQGLPNASMLAADFTEIADDIRTEPDDVFITKKTWNAFYNTPLHDELQKRGVTGIVLGGISTSIGVEGTARAASELGYNLSFATDAMTDAKMEAHENSIRNIFPRIGELGSSSDIIEKLHDRV